MMQRSIQEKEDDLKHLIGGYGATAIAYSGGLDSTYLAAVSHEVLKDKMQLIIADSPSLPRSELDQAEKIAVDHGWSLLRVSTKEMEKEPYVRNDKNRCYFCKKELFEHMRHIAGKLKINVLAYGAVMDDLEDHRPGSLAADDYRVKAPLQEAGLTKKDIRALSKKRALATYAKPAAACLASRIPTGVKVTYENLKQIEDAEEILREMGFSPFRVRYHGTLCRIEITRADIYKIQDDNTRSQLVHNIKSCGFKYVTLDLAGYRKGLISKDISQMLDNVMI